MPAKEAPAPPKLIRRDDWAEKLTDYIVESQQMKVALDWEFFNCGSWVGGAIEAMTGVDLYEPWEGKTSSATEAYKTLKRLGFDKLEAFVASRLPRTEIAFVRRGDLVFVGVPTDGTDYGCLGMPEAIALADPPFYWALSPQGLGRGLLSEATSAYAVGGTD